MRGPSRLSILLPLKGSFRPPSTCDAPGRHRTLALPALPPAERLANGGHLGLRHLLRPGTHGAHQD